MKLVTQLQDGFANMPILYLKFLLFHEEKDLDMPNICLKKTI